MCWRTAEAKVCIRYVDTHNYTELAVEHYSLDVVVLQQRLSAAVLWRATATEPWAKDSAQRRYLVVRAAVIN